jgi:hypothetical protein
MLKHAKIPIIVLLVVLMFAGGFFVRDQVGCSNSTVIQHVLPSYHDTLRTEDLVRRAEMQLIRLDLNEYPHLSTTIKDQMAQAILEASERYRLPPALIHAIIQIESEYRFNIDHPTVTLKVKGKMIKTSCKGLGGILWESWEDRLRAEGIAEKVSDMYLPRNNILAIGYILRTIIDDELAKNRDGWIVRRVIAQYYGAPSAEYEAKMRSVTSNLWLKRIAREIQQLSSADSTKRSE